MGLSISDDALAVAGLLHEDLAERRQSMQTNEFGVDYVMEMARSLISQLGADCEPPCVLLALQKQYGVSRTGHAYRI